MQRMGANAGMPRRGVAVQSLPLADLLRCAVLCCADLLRYVREGLREPKRPAPSAPVPPFVQLMSVLPLSRCALLPWAPRVPAGVLWPGRLGALLTSC